MNNFIYQAKTKTGKTVSFRYLTIDDVQIITDFINKASKEKTFITFQGEILSLEDEQKYVQSKVEAIEKKESVALLAFIENKLIGSSGLDLETKIKSHQGLFGIIIDHDCRGEGVGKILMELVIEEAIKNIKGLKIITLEVFGSNFIAQNLYKKMGFVEFGKLPQGIKYKGNFEDEILMYKKIK